MRPMESIGQGALLMPMSMMMMMMGVWAHGAMISDKDDQASSLQWPVAGQQRSHAALLMQTQQAAILGLGHTT
jgi:hypothetical protein